MLGSNKSKIEKLTKRSADIFSVFTKTQTELAEVNLSIQEEVDGREVEIKKLTTEVDTLNAIKDKNTKLSTKIDSFLAD